MSTTSRVLRSRRSLSRGRWVSTNAAIAECLVLFLACPTIACATHRGRSPAAPATSGSTQAEPSEASSRSEAPAGERAREDRAPEVVVIPESNAPARVRVHSTDRPVIVAQVTEHMHMTSTSQYLQISSHGQQWHDLCASPCKFQMPPGVIELLFYGNGVTEAQDKFVVRPGSNVIRVDPGSNAAYQGFLGAEVLGVLAMTAGAALLVIAAASPEYEHDYSTDERVRDPTVAKYWSWGAWLTGLGSVGFVGGMIGRRLTDTEVDIEHGDPPATTSGRSREGSASPPFGASLKGTF